MSGMKWINPGKAALTVLVFSFCMLAMGAQAVDLKAYYEQQKLELKPTFTAPAPESILSLGTLDGQKHEGELIQLTDTGVQIASGDKLMTFRRRELTEESCAQLFAEDYAHVAAIKRTRAYKRKLGGDKKNPVVQVSTLSVKDKYTNSIDREDKTKNYDDGAVRYIETKTKTKVQDVSITVANRGSAAETYSLEWYFFCQEIGEDPITIQRRGSEEIKLDPRQKVQRKIRSNAYVSKKVANNYVACCGKSTYDEEESGKEAKGYLVLLKRGDEVVARKSSHKEYLNVDWVQMCKNASVATR